MEKDQANEKKETEWFSFSIIDKPKKDNYEIGDIVIINRKKYKIISITDGNFLGEFIGKENKRPFTNEILRLLNWSALQRLRERKKIRVDKKITEIKENISKRKKNFELYLNEIIKEHDPNRTGEDMIQKILKRKLTDKEEGLKIELNNLKIIDEKIINKINEHKNSYKNNQVFLDEYNNLKSIYDKIYYLEREFNIDENNKIFLTNISDIIENEYNIAIKNLKIKLIEIRTRDLSVDLGIIKYNEKCYIRGLYERILKYFEQKSEENYDENDVELINLIKEWLKLYKELKTASSEN